MKAKCRIKRGFLVLRECGKRSVSRCNECMRQMCELHRSDMDDRICVECSVKRKQATQGSDFEDVSWHQRDAPFAYRRCYYEQHSYRPFYAAAYYDSYYDDYDVRGFDYVEESAFEGNDEGVDFYDS